MKNVKKMISGLIMSTAALVTAFLALAVPFKLFGTLEGAQLRAIFLVEVAAYFVLGMLFLVFRERKRVKKEQAYLKRIERRQKFQKAQEEYYDLAA